MTADYLRPKAAAARFGVHRSTLADWAEKGLIGRSRVGGVVFFNAADIAEVIAAHETKRVVVPLSTPTPPSVAITEPAWVAEFWGVTPPARARGEGR